MNMRDYITKNAVKIYLFCMLGIFPLYVRNFYFDITYAKFIFFRNMTIVFVVLYLLVKDIEWKNLIKRIMRTPFMIYALFVLVSGISVLLSEHRIESLWGTAGRYNGWMTWFLYALLFFVLLIEARIAAKWLYVFELSSILVAVLAILNHFYMDPFGFFKGIEEDAIASFATTLGNINIVGEFLAVAVTFSGVLFILKGNLIHGITYIVNLLALISNRTNSQYLGVAFFLILVPFFSKNKKHLLRYMRSIAYFILACIVFGLINQNSILEKEFDGIGWKLCSNYLKLVPILAVLVVIYILFRYRWKQNTDMEFFCKYKKIYGVSIVCCLLVALIGLIIINLDLVPILENTWLHNLKITDKFGTGRGVLWSVAMDAFGQMNRMEKLFGVGPDTSYFVYKDYADVWEFFYKECDNAHNVFLQLLIGQGIVGVSIFILWLVQSGVYCYRQIKNNEMYVAILLSVGAYFLMACVGLNTINISAIVMLLLGMSQCDLYEER